jgi:excisionase family DNA binding protein
MPAPTLYKVDEIAALLGVKYSFIRKLLTTSLKNSPNRIYAYKVGGNYRISLEQRFFAETGLTEYLAQKEEPMANQRISPIVFTPKQVAMLLNVSRETVMRLLYRGSFQSFKVGRTHRIPIDQPYFRNKGITLQAIYDLPDL